jgi:hypothetical protein
VGGHVALKGEKRNAFGLLVAESDEERPPRRRWVDRIMMDLVETRVSDLEWIGLAQDRYRKRALVDAVMDFQVT